MAHVAHDRPKVRPSRFLIMMLKNTESQVASFTVVIIDLVLAMACRPSCCIIAGKFQATMLYLVQQVPGRVGCGCPVDSGEGQEIGAVTLMDGHLNPGPRYRQLTTSDNRDWRRHAFDREKRFLEIPSDSVWHMLPHLFPTNTTLVRSTIHPFIQV